MCIWYLKDRKVEKWKTFLFGWKEKWEDENWSWYKFTVISLLNKTKGNTFFLLKICLWIVLHSYIKKKKKINNRRTQNFFIKKTQLTVWEKKHFAHDKRKEKIMSKKKEKKR